VDEAVVILTEIANCFGSVSSLLTAYWHDFDGLAVLFGVSAEQLTATFKAAGVLGEHKNKKVTKPVFLADKFKTCLESCADASDVLASDPTFVPLCDEPTEATRNGKEVLVSVGRTNNVKKDKRTLIPFREKKTFFRVGNKQITIGLTYKNQCSDDASPPP